MIINKLRLSPYFLPLLTLALLVAADLSSADSKSDAKPTSKVETKTRQAPDSSVTKRRPSKAFQMEPIWISKDALDAASKTYKETPGYLSIDLPFAPIKSVFDELQKRLGQVKIVNRGEAHITVITPPEIEKLKILMSYDDVLKKAYEMNLQGASYHLACLGTGTKGKLATYFITVHSEQIVFFRKAIEKEFDARANELRKTNPDKFAKIGDHFKAEPTYLHVTVGFTKTDLHEPDVFKNDETCIAEIKLQEN